MKSKYFYKQNIVRLCVLLAVPIVIALAAVLQKGFVFHCPYRTWCGFLCPGCGITRAFGEMMHLHLWRSIRLNPAALLLAIIGLGEYIEQTAAFFGKTITVLPRNKWVYISIGIVFALYCVLRNIPKFQWLSVA